MPKAYRPSLVSRSSVLESKLSHNSRTPNGFASEPQTSFEEKTSRFALKNMSVCHHKWLLYNHGLPMEMLFMFFRWLNVGATTWMNRQSRKSLLLVTKSRGRHNRS